jgi:3',5'-cyclic AMP phosphodiesterase CpdA
MTPTPLRPVRLVHVSDVHVAAAGARWRAGDFFSKRITGWVNLRLLGRGTFFVHCERILAALAADCRGEPPDRLIFSGDATALGLAAEMERAARLLGVHAAEAIAGLAVPGNHDYYTPADEARGAFERCFAPWQAGRRIDGATYPFAQQVGHLWLVGVNSCRGHRRPTDASGLVGRAQLDRLERLFGELEPGPRLLVTHYPAAGPDGRPEKPHHGLRDVADLVAVARRGGVGLWLHGHQHRPYRLDDPQVAPFPVICVGSTTDSRSHGYNRYTVAGSRLTADRRVYDPVSGVFRAGESFTLDLAGA